ncbi:MAG: c-type cytochrome [Myxococcales bacterium]|nr:c-type cytochrome [Myxococcales bacterium]
MDFQSSKPERPVALSAALTAPAWTSGHGLAATDAALFVVDRDNGALVRMERKSLAVKATVAVGERPEQVVVGPDDAAFVTVRAAGDVVRVGADFSVERRAHLGTETYGLALSADGRTLYVTLPHDGQLVTLDAATLEELDRMDTLALPRAVAVSPLNYLFVTHETDAGLRVGLDMDGLPNTDDALPIGLRQGNPADFLMGRTATLHQRRALAATIDQATGGVFIAHVQASPGDSNDFIASATGTSVNGVPVDQPTDGGGYGTTAQAGATFDIPTRPVEVSVTSADPTGTVAPAQIQNPVADPLTGEPMTALVDQPSDIASSPTWSLAIVTGYGTDNAIVLNTASQDPMRSPLAIIDAGRAPRAVAFAPDGKMAYILNDQELTVSSVDLTPLFSLPAAEMDDFGTSFATSDAFAEAPSAMPMQMEGDLVEPTRLNAAKTVAFGKDPVPAQIRRGQRVFTYARNERLSHAGEFACATCHFEGTEDKLVWFITDGPRQTPSLAGRLLGTAPFNWNGSKDELKSNMEQTVARMGGAGLSKSELTDLEQFLLYGLQAPKNPNLAADGQLTAEQQLGKTIFESSEAKCTSCHRVEQDFTDGFSHNVGTASAVERTIWELKVAQGQDPGREPGLLNTPTLKGLFYTAPYLHDGSAKTLEEALDRTADTMGKTSHLSKEEKSALIAYLKTL